jgi:hypothetical protein
MLNKINALLLLLLWNFSFGQQAPSSLLWKIENPNNKNVSYLFGTMHLMSEEDFYLPKEVKKKLLGSKELYLEITEESAKNLNPKLLQNDKVNFILSLDDTQKTTLFQWAREDLMMDENQFQQNFKNAKPFLIYQFILQTSLPEKLSSQEKELESWAKKDGGISILGLETVEEQLSFFDSIGWESQIDLIMNTLKNKSNAKEEFLNLQTLYLSQNLEKINEEVLKNEADIPNFNSVFIEQRNKNWALKLNEKLQSKTLFIAVGAAHLGGKDGLIQLLIDAGFQLSPITL